MLDDKAADYEGMTLAEALCHADETRWRGRRSRCSAMCQARAALATLTAIIRPDLAHLAPPERNAAVMHADVMPGHLKAAVKKWRADGCSPRLCNRRVTYLSALGFVTVNLYTTVPKTLKWWLKPDAQAALLAMLEESGEHLMADYIIWATSTGLRVEESLRLTRSDFSAQPTGRILMTVPGLKTHDAQATLPLSPEAEGVYLRRLAPQASPDQRLFAIGYASLNLKWMGCRLFLGVAGDKGATLKALRRNAARNLHVAKAMPLDMVRQYLRHEGIATTMGYLRLTGGYGADEYARYL